MHRTSRLLLLALCLNTAPLAVAQDAPKPAAQAEEKIDMNKARELHRRAQSGEKLSAEEQAYLDRAKAARAKGEVGRAAGGKSNPAAGKESVGFKPLTEMSADDRYKDQDGGLYGKGQNTPPEGHAKAAAAALAAIKPLDADGKPAADGKIGFISISMSNATQEFSTYVPLADADPAKSPKVQVVDCAQGGQAMAEWVDPQAKAWQTTDQRLRSHDLSPNQVQVVWIKLANKSPQGDLQRHGRKLQRDTEAVIHNAMNKFPNLKIAYLSSRTYGGWSGGSLNPEPYAYEGAFVVRWLIDDQIAGNAELNYDPKRGEVKAPLLLWGPYFWADGVVPRKDGLTYPRDDFGPDGTHPLPQGREKVAKQLLDFFKNDPLASSWYRGPGK